MPDLVADASRRLDFNKGRHQIGGRVLISRGPLAGLSGLIAELAGDEVLVDLRGTVDGLLVRCRKQQLVIQPVPA